MKRKTIAKLITLVTVLLLPAMTSAQEALFEKFNDADGITTIYISKTMMQMIPNVKAGKHEVGAIASKLDELRVLSCENRKTIASVKKQFADYYKSNQYEIIMQANDSEEHATIYHKKLKGGKAVFALMSEEDDEISIIYVKGNITLKDIQQITGK